MKKNVSDKVIFTGFKEEPSIFYNKIYSDKSNDYNDLPENSRFYGMWEHILKDFINNKSVILDIGCGTGQFGLMCINKKHKYIGIDYSDIAIKIARKMCRKGKFMVKDIMNDNTPIVKWHYNVITFIEFLEHVQNDIGIIRSVPKGKTIIMTLPSFGGKPHIRYFPTILSGKERYNKFIDFKKFCWIGKKHIIIMGIRK